MVVFADDASGEKVGGNLLDDIAELQLVGKVGGDGLAF